MKPTVLLLPAIGPNAIKTGFIGTGGDSGAGAKRRRDLLTHFGGIQGVLKASEKDLQLVPGLGSVMARMIYKILHE